MISIQPNWDFLLWFILISYFLGGIISIWFGTAKTKKDTHYGNLDIVAGILRIILIVVYLIWA